MSNSLDAHCTHCLSGPKLELGQPAAQACAAARTLRRRRTGRRRRVNMVRQLCSGHVMLIVRLLLANTLLNQTVSSFTILGKLNNYRNSVLNTHGISKFSGICSVNTCKDPRYLISTEGQLAYCTEVLLVCYKLILIAVDNLRSTIQDLAKIRSTNQIHQ